ncbi:MAG: hypothetical protein IKM20_10035 [Erysipelotrichales bacterium]|nr:hypothetical protein [Erysipelotrichales bacterium]
MKNIIIVYYSILIILVFVAFFMMMGIDTNTVGAVDISSGTITYECYEGERDVFHAKKIEYTELEGENILANIQSSEEWKELPLPPNLYKKLYINRTFHNEYDFLEEVENGYYYFRNKNYEDIDDFYNDGYSYNIIVAIYDVDNRIMYYIDDNS